MNVIMKILEQNDANILSNNSDEKVRLKCSSRLSVLEAVKKELVNATSGNVVIKG